MRERVKILVVDDEEVIRNLLADVLTDEGCEVTTVPRGAEAIAKVKEEMFNIVFSDVHMPGINGAETIRTIKESRPETIVVMMDSYPDHLLDLAQEIGVFTCLHKPFDIKDVVTAVEEIKCKYSV